MIGKANEVFRCTVGSQVHGLDLDGTDDHDEMGIFIEPPTLVLGIPDGYDHEVQRTQPEGVRSGPGDTDLVRYSLRKYLRLAVQGNPTVLLPLFAPVEFWMLIAWPGFELRERVPQIVSQRAGPRFLGYMKSQRERMEGTRKRHTNRPELIEQYGYDTKFASHAVRLGLQGIELLTKGSITLPMPEVSRQHLRDMKAGKVGREDALREIVTCEQILSELVAHPPDVLPEQPDLDALNAWSRDVHLRWWSQNGLDG